MDFSFTSDQQELRGLAAKILAAATTLARTTRGAAAAGTDVNLEADVVARHVARLREFAPAAGPGVAADDLSRWGYGGAR